MDEHVNAVKTPKTDDETSPALPAAAMLISVLGLAVVLKKNYLNK